jgi:phage-related minor tail protein
MAENFIVNFPAFVPFRGGPAGARARIEASLSMPGVLGAMASRRRARGAQAFAAQNSPVSKSRRPREDPPCIAAKDEKVKNRA